MIRCILLDLDGTLVNTWDLYVEAYIRALEPHLGHRLNLEELIRLRPNSELRLLQRGAGGADAQRAYGEFLRHYGSLHPTHFGGVYPGVHEMLAALRSRRLSIGIVTGKSRAAWEITAAETDLGPFDVVVTDEDVAEAKPDPAGLILALDRLAVAAGQAVYVGDAVADAKAALAAGVRFAAALWSKSETELGGFMTQVREVGVWAELPNPGSLVAALTNYPQTNGMAETPAGLHAEVDEQSTALHALHAKRLQCRKGCSGCCADDLTVFAVEAESIRRSYGELLARGIPHREGACAFLDDTGACRIYVHRPYVCRTQGLPLRWIEERDGGPVELRDICPLNEAGDPVETLPTDACWTIGPFEERLRRLQLAAGGRLTRVRLRDLFENGPTCETLFLNREAP